MGRVSVQLLNEADAADLLRFELENREFFTRTVGGRDAEFYTLEGIQASLESIAAAQAEGSRYMYAARNEAGEIVGRVNLYDIELGDLLVAEVGYRFSERHNGKGYATEALRLVLHEAFDTYGLHRVEAHTTPDNIASQIVLVKNGFVFEGRARGYIRVHGVWRDFLQFAVLVSDGE